MRLNITARKFKLTDSLKEHAEKEVQRLTKYYDGILDVDVILSWEKADRLAEVNAKVFGTVLSAHDRSDTMQKAIGGAVDKLERQVKKYKAKIRGFDHEKVTDEPVSLTEAAAEKE